MKSQIAFMFGAHCLAFLVVFPPGILGTFGLERKEYDDERIDRLPTDMSIYDKNGDGVVDYEEFTLVVMEQFTLDNPSELKKVFTRADANRDKQLDKTEMKSLKLEVQMGDGNDERRDLSMPKRGIECRLDCGWSGCSLVCN